MVSLNLCKEYFKYLNICTDAVDRHNTSVITVRLHVMQRTVLPTPFCPSVKCLGCEKTKEACVHILL